MSRTALLELLRQRLGLDPTVLGERVLEDAFTEARRTLGVANDTALFSRAVADPEGFAELIEHFVVPETWFFRAAEQFQDLVQFARGLGQSRQPLRILSLPCATGEEAYSAAMTLFDAGFAPEQIEVLGVDVSRRFVERARLGVYRRNAVRGDPLTSPWVHAELDSFGIDPLVKRCVRFRVGNALDERVFDPGERFDVVFCRNLLIYLHDAARTQLLQVLGAVLAQPALVLAGQAEVLSALSADFVPMGGASPLSYLFNPANERSRRGELSPPAAPRLDAMPPMPRTIVPAAIASAPVRTPEAPVAKASIAHDDLEEARRLADLGQLDAARQRCSTRLESTPQDVAALYLLGLIESARGDVAAADAAFARVLYLDGDHAEALEHRIALAERSGQSAAVEKLRARAQRLRQRRGSAA